MPGRGARSPLGGEHGLEGPLAVTHEGTRGIGALAGDELDVLGNVLEPDGQAAVSEREGEGAPVGQVLGADGRHAARAQGAVDGVRVLAFGELGSVLR